MHDAPGAPVNAGERAVVTIPSIRRLYVEHCGRSRVELLTEFERGDRVEVTVRPLT